MMPDEKQDCLPYARISDCQDSIFVTGRNLVGEKVGLPLNLRVTDLKELAARRFAFDANCKSGIKGEVQLVRIHVCSADQTGDETDAAC